MRIALIISVLTAVSEPALAMRWGTIRPNHCSQMERRQHSAQLLDIPWGKSWEAACASTPATINGTYFARPTRCVNKGPLGMWGEWDVPDSRCPYWSTVKADSCRSMGHRQYSAQIMDVPSGVSWEYACANKPATINGIYFAKPTRCINMGVGMWGEWDVPDEGCPHWGTISAHECSSIGFRRHSAQILDVPSTVSWEYACANEPATINGTFFARPTRCANMTVGMWGEWQVPDATCPHWSEFEAGSCRPPAGDATGRRLYSAQLLEIPSGLPWKQTCESTPATIQGHYLEAPAYCTEPLLRGVWGHFEVPDQSCPFCGDGVCRGGYSENCRNCPGDCGPCPVCGDGKCEGSESPLNCTADCGTCGNRVCDAGETPTSCAPDCGCGNGTCSADESCSSCAADCGACQLTCAGNPVSPETQYFNVGIKNPYSLCAERVVSMRADSLDEAEECAQKAYPGYTTVTSGSVGWYTYHTDPTYGCAQSTVPAFSASDGEHCAAYLGYTLPGPCP